LDKRKNNSGTIGNKGGRPARSEEQKLIETLTPLQPKAMIAFNAGLQDGERWAVELFFKYFYGLPKQQIDHTTQGDKINVPVINVHSEH
jgi:hypothetical protein